MPIYGIDVSSFQTGINMAQVASEGFSFVIVKATEGDNYVNPAYNNQVQGALNAGLYTMSYHFVHAADEDGQVAEVERYVRKDLPVWLDSEVDGSGEYAVSADLVRRLRAAGWNVVGTYIPAWFWSQIGSPDLRPLGLLWSSGYPSKSSGYASALYPGDNAVGWAQYGFVTPSLYQFTDRGLVAGYSVDCSAFKGSVAQLSALMNGSTTPQGYVDNMTNYIVKLSTAVTNAGVTTYPDCATQDGDTIHSVDWANAAATIAKQNGGGLTGLTDAQWADRDASSSLIKNIQPTVNQLDVDLKAGFAALQATLAQILSALQNGTGGTAPTAAAVAQAVMTAEQAERTKQLGALGYVPDPNHPPV